MEERPRHNPGDRSVAGAKDLFPEFTFGYAASVLSGAWAFGREVIAPAISGSEFGLDRRGSALTACKKTAFYDAVQTGNSLHGAVAAHVKIGAAGEDLLSGLSDR